MVNYISFFSIILLFVYPNYIPGFSICPFFTITSIPCPGCGIGRGLLSIYNLELIQALKYNPFSFLILYYQIKIGVLFWFRKNHSFKKERLIVNILLFLLIAYWIARMTIWKYFPQLGIRLFIDIRNTESLVHYLIRIFVH